MVRPGRDKLSGVVEVDETFIGFVHAGKRGRGAEGKSLVFIAVEETEHGIGRIRLSVIKDATARTLATAVQETIASQSSPFRRTWWLQCLATRLHPCANHS